MLPLPNLLPTLEKTDEDQGLPNRDSTNIHHAASDCLRGRPYAGCTPADRGRPHCPIPSATNTAADR